MDNNERQKTFQVGKRRYANEYPYNICFGGLALRFHYMAVKLFVGGIPYRMTVDELRATFTQAGEVTDVFIPMDRMTGRPRGFAFVEMATQEGADKAIQMFHDQEVGGRRIAVNIARPLEERPARAPRM